MKFTGERLHSEINEYWAVEHFHRYAIAQMFVKNKAVLDIACGEGYGSNLLSKQAATVIGVDISQEAVEFANSSYKSPNLKFKQGAAQKIPVPDGSIDVVVSFETIEHHDQHIEMMQEIKRVLKKDGILIISSPDKKYYTDEPNYQNPFHVKELYEEEFKSLLSNYFQESIFFSQRTVYGSLLNSSDKRVNGFLEFEGNANSFESFDKLRKPLYHLAVCSDFEINQSLFKNSFFNAQSTLQTMLQKQKFDIDQFYSKSFTFRVGKSITAPYHFIKKLIAG